MIELSTVVGCYHCICSQLPSVVDRFVGLTKAVVEDRSVTLVCLIGSVSLFLPTLYINPKQSIILIICKYFVTEHIRRQVRLLHFQAKA